MAVVFISPKKKQKTFFMGITLCLVLFLASVSLWVFLIQPKVPAPKVVFNKPKVNVDLKILDSDQFKNLENFELMPLQFEYVAKTDKNKTLQGYEWAVSSEEAQKNLEKQGLDVTSIEEVGIGRDNPFIPY